MAQDSATKTIIAQNTFSDAIPLGGMFNVSISGTFVATVTLQRSFGGGSTWLDVKAYTVPAEEVGSEPEATVMYRIGVKTGDFTSGTVEVRISR